jgi:replicative DNA helicase
MLNDSLFQNDAETAVLSIILQNPDSIHEIQSIKSGMFSSKPNELLFTTVQELAQQNLVPDVNLIDSLLKSQNRDLQVGGRDYLNYLYKQSYNKSNIREFERIVVDSWKARTLISLATGLPPTIMQSKDIDGIINKTRMALDALTQTSGGELTSNFEDALKLSWTEMMFRVANPGIRGTTTGLISLDSVTNGMCPGDLWIIMGRPGSGKTALMCNSILGQGRTNGASLIFSLEMKKVPLIERMLAMETGISSNDIRMGLLDKSKIDTLSEAIKKIKSYPIYIDANYSGEMNYVLTTVRRYKSLYNIKVVYIDYIQLLAERNIDATNEIGRITRALKLLANELDITVVIGSQLNRGVEAREDKRPMISDMRQSGNLEEDADVVLGLYRDIMYNKKTADKKLLEMLILKQRNGPTGMLPVTFEAELMKLTDRI